jgi:hypothetical protein
MGKDDIFQLPLEPFPFLADSGNYQVKIDNFSKDLLSLNKGLLSENKAIFVPPHEYSFPIGYNLQCLLHLAYDIFGWTSTLELFKFKIPELYVNFLPYTDSNKVDYSVLYQKKQEFEPFQFYILDQMEAQEYKPVDQRSISQIKTLSPKDIVKHISFPDLCDTTFLFHSLLNPINFTSYYVSNAKAIENLLLTPKIDEIDLQDDGAVNGQTPDEHFLFVFDSYMMYNELPKDVHDEDLNRSFKLAFFIYTASNLPFLGIMASNEEGSDNPDVIVFGDHFHSFRPFPEDVHENIIFAAYIPSNICPKIIPNDEGRRCVPIHDTLISGDKMFLDYLLSLPNFLTFKNNTLSVFFETTLYNPFSFLKSCGFNHFQIVAAYLYNVASMESVCHIQSLINQIVPSGFEDNSTAVWMQYVYLGVFAWNLKTLIIAIQDNRSSVIDELTNLISCVPLKCKEIYPMLLRALKLSIDYEKKTFNKDQLDVGFHRVILDVVGPQKYLEFCTLMGIKKEFKTPMPSLNDGFFHTHIQNSFNFHLDDDDNPMKASSLIYSFEEYNTIWESSQFDTPLEGYSCPPEYQTFISWLGLDSPITF